MPKAPAQKPPIRWRPRPLPIAAAGAAAFIGLTGFLGLRVAGGDDPALAGSPAATAQVPADTAPSVTSDDTTSSGDTSGQATENPSTGTSGG